MEPAGAERHRRAAREGGEPGGEPSTSFAQALVCSRIAVIFPFSTTTSRPSRIPSGKIKRAFVKIMFREKARAGAGIRIEDKIDSRVTDSAIPRTNAETDCQKTSS